MKTEPKFRGKSVETGERVYGCGWYHINYTEEHKKENNMSERANLLTKNGFVECYLDSMGRYTGLEDKNSIEIYENDIVSITEGFNHVTVGRVEWGLSSDNYGTYPAFCIFNFESEMNSFSTIYDTGVYEIEVVNNMYDNHELAKGAT